MHTVCRQNAHAALAPCLVPACLPILLSFLRASAGTHARIAHPFRRLPWRRRASELLLMHAAFRDGGEIPRTGFVNCVGFAQPIKNALPYLCRLSSLVG